MIFFNKISNSETNFDSKVDNKSAMMLLGVKSDDNHDRSLSSNTETQILKETIRPKAIALRNQSSIATCKKICKSVTCRFPCLLHILDRHCQFSMSKLTKETLDSVQTLLQLSKFNFTSPKTKIEVSERFQRRKKINPSL